MADLSQFTPTMPNWATPKVIDPLNGGGDWYTPEHPQAMPELPGWVNTALDAAPPIQQNPLDQISQDGWARMDQDKARLMEQWQARENDTSWSIEKSPEYQAMVGKITPKPISDGALKVDEHGRIDFDDMQLFAQRYGIPLPSEEDLLAATPDRMGGAAITGAADTALYANKLINRPIEAMLADDSAVSTLLKLPAIIWEGLAKKGEKITDDAGLPNQEFVDGWRKDMITGTQSFAQTAPSVLAGGLLKARYWPPVYSG